MMYTDSKIKCGLVTYHNSHNYGSVLQTYAMVKTLETFGLDVEVINYQSPYTITAYQTVLWSPYKTIKLNAEDFILQYILQFGRKREKAFNRFINTRLPLTQPYKTEKEIPDKYDILICGSDQIWNPIATGKAAPVYFLAFGNKDCIRFSYAASSGSKEFEKDKEKERYDYLTKFKQIGVRETFMKEYLHKKFNLNSTVNPDPTIFLSSRDWAAIESPVNGLPPKYLLIYSLARIEEVLAFAHQIARKLNLPVAHINPARRTKYLKYKNTDYNLNKVSPEQFLWLFHHATFIVTNTFHGNMFSIIFRKDFINYTPDKNDTRIQTLHNAIGLGNSRQLAEASQFTNDMLHIDYSVLEPEIQTLKESGLSFIKQAIK